MKKVMLAGLVAGLTIAGVMAGVTAVSADPMEGAVKARRAYYQVVLSNWMPLAGMMKGEVEYDAAKAQTFADNLKLISQTNNGHMWPKGSANDNAALKGQTRALPAIWAEGSEIGAKGKAWRDAIAALADDAGKGKDAMIAQAKLVGASCGACHKPYRAKDF